MASKSIEGDVEKKADGLEIISIGFLYTGPWDKKYWSSSRGKDRYPYPVGYQARRVHNGSSYKLEIQEGPKGPLFLISSVCDDLHSCSGQTPDIAWENFQKKGCQQQLQCRPKIWYGKRFSCKIDGVEFFGFKNPLVQRLLRELVANVNGIAEQSVSPSSSCSGASRAERSNPHPDECKGPELLSVLARPQITGKRSKRREIIHPKTSSISRTKRPRSGDPMVGGNSNLLSRGNVPLNPVNCADRLRGKTVPDHEDSKCVGSENCKPTSIVAEEKSPDRSEVTEMEELNSQVQGEDTAGDEEASKVSQGNTSILDLPTRGESTCCVKEDLSVSSVDISERVIIDSHPEEEIGTSNSNASSDKSDFDSVGQEIAKSMITLLLPQAIPLLKKTSSKKMRTEGCPENLPSMPKAHEEDNETGYLLDTQSPTVDHTVNKSVIPDSLDNDSCGGQLILPSTNNEANRPNVYKDAYATSSMELLVNVDTMESLFCHVQTSGIEDSIHHHEVQFNLSKRPRDGNLCLSDSDNKKVISEDNLDLQKILDENSLGVKSHCEEEGLKYVPDCNEVTSDASIKEIGSSMQFLRKDIIKPVASEIGNVPITQVPKKVYTRKKVPSTMPTARNYNAPLSESIICRNFEEGSFPKSSGSFIPLRNVQKIFSADKPHQGVFGADHRVRGQLQGLKTDKSTINANSESNSEPHFLSKTQAFFHASECKYASKLDFSSESHAEELEAQFKKNLVGHNSMIEGPGPIISQKNELEFCSNKTCREQEVQDSELKLHDLELNSELGDIAELVGCYFHPMPVLLLLLSTNRNGVYVCALCGIQVDKDRTLFLYKLAIDEAILGSPSFVGHTSLTIPSSVDSSSKEVALERSGLQLTPDGQCLVLLDCIKTPYCRQGRINCECSICTSDCSEHNAVKIVEVKAGYVSVLVKLRTPDSIRCILVCEPNYLVGTGESGRLHLWAMNPTWSEPLEEFAIPANDCMAPCIVELKRIPKCASLIVGHNGFGEFAIWDISKQILISRFCAPNTPVHQFFPISCFSWQKEFHGFSYSSMEDHINRIMDAINLFFSEQSENHSLPQSEGEDIAIWLLVSTVSTSDDHYDHESSDCQTNPVGWWRLALLVKNMLILGSTLDPRAAAIDTSAGHGIIGTLDGLVYMWELSTGNKLGTLHHFKDGSVSCIAADDSRSSVVAVAGDRGQLLVYRRLQQNGANR